MRPGAALACLAVLAAGAMTVSAAAAERAPRPIVVTVDDLPMSGGSLHTDPADRERITHALLDVLARHHVPAVGFVIWGNVRGEADRNLLDAWLAAGHELGNHTARHLDYSKTDIAAYTADVEAGRAGLAAFLAERGKTGPRWFRFPYLGEGDTQEKLAAMRAELARSRQRNLVVTIDDQDWSFERPWVTAWRANDVDALHEIADGYQSALRAAVRHYEELGDDLFGRTVPQVLLLHATEVGAAQWDALFTWLERTGHRFVAPDAVMSDAALSETPAFTSDHGSSHWDRVRSVRWSERAQKDVRQLLDDQAAAWNRGDLDAFTSVYADDALFLSPSGTTRGRAAVLARYREHYPDRAAMGTLSFDVHEVRVATGTEVTPAGDAVPSRVHGASVAATWHIARPGQPTESGPTLLVLHRTAAGWRIVQDASASAAEPGK